jgi:hypothetical protein
VSVSSLLIDRLINCDLLQHVRGIELQKQQECNFRTHILLGYIQDLMHRNPFHELKNHCSFETNTLTKKQLLHNEHAQAVLLNHTQIVGVFMDL